VSVLLTPNGTISGRVLDANGATIPNASVSIGEIGYNQGRRVLNTQGSAQVDSRGNYEITPRGGSGEFFLRLDPGAARGFGGTYYPGVTDINDAVRVPVQPGQRVVGIDFQMANPTLYKVSGRILNLPPHVVPPGQPDGTVSSLTFASADSEYVDTQTTPLRMNERPGPNGEFELSLPAGFWDIFPVVNLRQGPLSAQAVASIRTGQAPVNATGRARVLVQDRNVENVTITIASEDISGRIVVEGTPIPAMDIMRITMAPADNIPSPLISHLRNFATNVISTNGTFSFAAVPPGRYTLELTALPSGYYVAGERVGTKNIYNDGIINVGMDPIDPVEVTLRSGGGRIRQNPASNPAIARYVLIPSGSNRQNSLLYMTSNTGGAFLDVAPGDYKVFAFAAPIPKSAERNEGFMKKYESFGVPVHVEDGKVSIFDVNPIPADQ
ncbi:MAG TPA: carboxypeptidase-like regulatory domain-containing protein, partial [Terriglobia bacterium]|nr:carboxypeptidase-like regulatory domain-containing protein [Terriglobia bacterium]